MDTSLSMKNTHTDSSLGHFLDKYIDKIVFEPNTGCWIWTGNRDSRTGIGRIYFPEKGNVTIRKYLIENLNEKLALGIKAFDSCGIKQCINPDHLITLSHAKIISKVSRTKEFCKYGHKAIRNKRHNCIQCKRINNKKSISYILRHRLDSRLAKVLKVSGLKKTETIVKLLGCTVSEFKKYIEEKFYNNIKTGETMSWNNYGKWHIDHVKPCKSFDLRELKQREQCFHWTNLQPLWAEENWSKGFSS